MATKKITKKMKDDLNSCLEHWKRLILENELPVPAVVSIMRSDLSQFKSLHRYFFKK